MDPEPWTTLEAPMVLLLSDVCDTLALDEEERATVLGQQGEQALAEILETCPVIRSRVSVSERQAGQGTGPRAGARHDQPECLSRNLPLLVR